MPEVVVGREVEDGAAFDWDDGDLVGGCSYCAVGIEVPCVVGRLVIEEKVGSSDDGMLGEVAGI